MEKKVKKAKKEKKVKDRSQILKKLLIVLVVLMALEVILIPFLVLAEVKRLIPVTAFIIMPTICGILIVLLARSCSNDYNIKKKKITQKLNNQ